MDSNKRQRERAHHAVYKAIQRGELLPANCVPCTDCSHIYDEDGPWHEYDHYLGYEDHNWLSVQAVCKPCHMKRTMQSDAWKNRPKRAKQQKQPRIVSPPKIRGRPPLPEGKRREVYSVRLLPELVARMDAHGNRTTVIEKAITMCLDKQSLT